MGLRLQGIKGDADDTGSEDGGWGAEQTQAYNMPRSISWP